MTSDEWDAARRRSRVCVMIAYTYTHPLFWENGHRDRPDSQLKRMERVIIVPHDGPLTDDALWEHIYKLIHRDGRTRSGTRLPYYEWLGDDITPHKWYFCTSSGRVVEHLTPRELQVQRALSAGDNDRHEFALAQ